jgi:hypothetical protein
MPGAIDVQKFINSLQKQYRPAAHEAAVLAVDQFCNFILGAAQEICPKKTGFLAASGYAEPPTDQEGLITGIVGFNAGYAAIVHERLDVYHEPPTQAKFLEVTMQANAGKFAPFVIAAINRRLGTT